MECNWKTWLLSLTIPHNVWRGGWCKVWLLTHPVLFHSYQGSSNFLVQRQLRGKNQFYKWINFYLTLFCNQHMIQNKRRNVMVTKKQSHTEKWLIWQYWLFADEKKKQKKTSYSFINILYCCKSCGGQMRPGDPSDHLYQQCIACIIIFTEQKKTFLI